MTTFGIITNTDTNFSPDGLGKSYYIENVKDNLYGIKKHLIPNQIYLNIII